MSTSLLREAARTEWDAIVIGAGPAGSVAARQAATAGLKTLLVDAKLFPRDKVCGGYLNRRALEALQTVGLRQVVEADSASRVQRIELFCGGQRACFPLPTGKVICRSTFDAALVQTAKSAGATLLLETQAVVEPMVCDSMRSVVVSQHSDRKTLRTRVVICADGLARTSVRKLPEFFVDKSSASRVGIGAEVRDANGLNPVGQITMVVSHRGYVGISRIGRDRLNIAGAIDQELLSQSTPVSIARSILQEAGLTVPTDLEYAIWRGTPALTSRPNQVAAERIFLIGDASGYVEPFTGEGMAAALESAVAVVRLTIRASSDWVPSLADCWTALHRQIVCDRQSTCRQLAWVLRRPWATRAAMRVCRSLPQVAGHLIARTTVPSTAFMSPGIDTP